ncbi:DUF438 domain-containing protein [Alkalibacter mobilis]|uniref:DUF438 domain-containing protein n=1 Tax=Alkalibacter mobilis TaxID=2787712 RepID=UPI00189CFE7C|nr:PAS domain-containing protein [Alkalibacter mobilis]MBF7097678.1 DUF438 domain-containing protein [Alkalibacter mobilis]
MEKRLERLISYCQGIYKNENGKELYDKYLEDIKTITPQDLIFVENEQLKLGLEPKEMLLFVDKLINVFYKYLKDYEWKKPKEDTFLFYLMAENKEFISRLKEFKNVIKTDDFKDYKDKTIAFIDDISLYDEHLLKLENILFPTMEKKMEKYDGLKIMWALHDEVRESLKNFRSNLESYDNNLHDLNIEIGNLYFKLYGLVQKQELILFPASTEVISEDEFEDLHFQSREYGFPYLDKPSFNVPKYKKGELQDSNSEIFYSETGNMTMEQVRLLMDTIPLDMTFVDENDKVVYFSRPKERIFPRSPAIIGRNVKNCHPPESVHIVDEILDSFKNASKSKAEFWLQRKNLFIYITYFALRDENGTYKGTLEVSQEISGLRALEGEQRLLQWK